MNLEQIGFGRHLDIEESTRALRDKETVYKFGGDHVTMEHKKLFEARIINALREENGKFADDVINTARVRVAEKVNDTL